MKVKGGLAFFKMPKKEGNHKSSLYGLCGYCKTSESMQKLCVCGTLEIQSMIILMNLIMSKCSDLSNQSVYLVHKTHLNDLFMNQTYTFFKFKTMILACFSHIIT